MLIRMGDMTARGETGRRFVWLAIGCALIGAPLYAVQLTVAGRTDTPWYLPAFGTLGLVFAVVALSRRRTAWRSLVLALVALLATAEWWFLLSYVRLPAYNGPVAAGEPFPAFTARRADGTEVSGPDFWNHVAFFRGDKAELPADRATALVVFRGRW